MKRVLLKISGEALSGAGEFGIEKAQLSYLVDEISSVIDQCALEIVVGGGNYFRGSIQGEALGMKRANADYMGMLGTILNGLALVDAIERRGVSARIASSIRMEAIAEPYLPRKVMRHLEKHARGEGERVVILVAGMGVPYFSTDTAMVHRGTETEADMVLKGTKEDGVFTADPRKDAGAELLKRVTFDDFITKNIGKIIDRDAIILAQKNNRSIRVFNIFTPGNLKKVIAGDDIGTLITA